MEEVRVLAFNFPEELKAVQTGLLSRPPFVSKEVSRAAELLMQLEGPPYRLMILNMPGDGLEFKQILPIVRNPKMPCSKGAVILLTPAERVEEHRAYLQKGLNVVLPRTVCPDVVELEVARQVEVAPRVSTRIMLRIKAKIQAQNTMIMCQTANISASGLFLVHKTILPVGTKFSFELMLPGAKMPIVGEARVVRHATFIKEKYEGMGATFLSLPPEGQKLIGDFVARTQSAAKA